MEVPTPSEGDADCYIIFKLLGGIQTHRARDLNEHKGFCFALRNVLDGQH